MISTVSATGSVPLSEVLGAFSHALDMTEGQPEGHCVRACWIGMHIGRKIGLSDHDLSELYYTLLMKDLGCSSNSARICELYLADDISFKRDFAKVEMGLLPVIKFIVTHTGVDASLAQRLRALKNIFTNAHEIVRGLTETRCHRGADIARKLRFSERVAEGIYSFDELWDGAGHPQGLAGEMIPIFSRIALLATVIDVFHNSNGADAAREEVRKRSGAWFDPALARAFERIACRTSFWAGLESPNIAELVFALEPAQHRVAVDEDYLDDIAAGFGQVVDAKSPFTAGHSARVELYADAIAAQMGVGAERRRWIRRAALLHDVGKLGVSNALLDKPARLEGDELTAVRAHALHTHTILSRISAFSQMAMTAAAHHERIDGAGYPFALKGEEISFETRVISTADFFDALTADRPYRKAMPVEQAMAIMKREVGAGIDPACFDALTTVVARMPAPEPVQAQQDRTAEHVA